MMLRVNLKPDTEGQKIKVSGFGKKLFIIGLLIDAVILIAILWFFLFFPRQEIASLKGSFVEIDLKGDKADYWILKEKPFYWVSLRDIDYTAAHAFVVSEDWSFYQHSGYDLKQIREAFTEAMKGGRKRGASTISQQVVKNIFLSPERSLSRKLKELVYSIYLERNVPKEKILEIYLNVIEFGQGLFGIKKAAYFYFEKEPKSLTPREAAFLSMLLPNPKRYAESFRKKEITDYAANTIDQILEKMVVAKYLGVEQLEKAKRQNFSWEQPNKYQDE